MSYDSRRALGFSLVELVIVITIVSVVAAIAVPRYQNSLMRYRAVRAAKRVAADVALARTDARTTGSARSLVFDTAGDGYSIDNMTSLDRRSNSYSVDFTKGPFFVDVVSASLGGDATLTFSGHGIPDSGGAVVLRAGDVEVTVQVNADTGRAQVQ